jgi:hypothetical protein
MRPVAGPQTSPFGVRWGRMHEGIDIGGPIGTPICAAASGVVVSAGWNAGYGRIVVIRHAGGLSTAYAHMPAITVGRGRAVAQGDVVGRRGDTGHSTGPHLHFETRLHGRAVDPAPTCGALPGAPGGAPEPSSRRLVRSPGDDAPTSSTPRRAGSARPAAVQAHPADHGGAAGGGRAHHPARRQPPERGPLGRRRGGRAADRGHRAGHVATAWPRMTGRPVETAERQGL